MTSRAFFRILPAALLLGTVLASAPAFAQFNWGQKSTAKTTTRVTPHRIYPKPEHAPAEFKCTSLKSAPQLPYLPSYTGADAKFIEGFTTPNLKTAKVYEMSFLVKEKPDQVKQWWQGALQGQGWKINPDASKGTITMAQMQNKGLIVHVIVGQAHKPPYQSSVSVRYIDRSQPGPKPAE